MLCGVPVRGPFPVLQTWRRLYARADVVLGDGVLGHEPELTAPRVKLLLPGAAGCKTKTPMRASAGVALVLVVLIAAFLLRGCGARGPAAPTTLQNATIICTVCSEGEGVPSAPVTFAARFGSKHFVSASSPVAMDEPEPPPQEGTYRYTLKSPACAALKLRQPEKSVVSELELVFTHSAGGTMFGTMRQAGALVARQTGFFHVCISSSQD